MTISRLPRRDFFRVTASAALAAGASSLAAGAAQSEADKRPPNLVLIMADDLGYECIGANGGRSYKTPVLDKLAAGGMRFEHCYAQPLCTPTRVKLMTGIYNVRNYIRFGILDPKQTTFAQLLKKAGYATCIVGKWQLLGGLKGPQHFGFDEYCLWQLTRRPSRYASPGLEVNGKLKDYPGGYGPDVAAEFACDFLTRNKDKPFLLYHPMILTHCPFEPTPLSKDWDPKSRGSKTYKGNPQYFADMVRHMDTIVGRIVAKLEALGLRENTLVLFTGDNGTDKPIVSDLNGTKIKAGKGLMTDAGTRVPLIANWPGKVAKGRVTRDLVDMSDFLPTLCEAAGVAVPPELNIDGRSFLPQLMGKEGQPREWIYCWYSRSGNPAAAQEWARTQRYKLYRTGKFYDVKNDPLEKRPLADRELSKEAQNAKALLQSALDKYKDARPAHLNKARPVRGKGRKKTPAKKAKK